MTLRDVSLRVYSFIILLAVPRTVMVLELPVALSVKLRCNLYGVIGQLSCICGWSVTQSSVMCSCAGIIGCQL